MKRFQFQLQTALDWRKRRMETEQARLDDLLLRQSQLHQALDDTGRSYSESQAAILQSTTIDAAELAALDAYRRALHQQKRRIEIEIARVKEALTNQRQILITATRDYRLMEKLKDRRLSEWRKQFDRELENEAAELYLSKHVRTTTRG